MTTSTPQVDSNPSSAIYSLRPFRVSLLSILISLAVLLPFLDYSPVFQVSEGREGVVVNELLNGTEYILPLRHGEIVPSKPILFHWLSAFIASVRGEYDAFGLRLPSALGAVMCCAVLGWVVAASVSPIAGLSSVLVLLTMYGYGHLAADGRVDMLFVAFVSVSILIWIYAASRKFAEDKTLRDIGHLPYFCVGLFSGLAILTKGPLGLVLPGLVIGCTALYYGGWRSALSLVKPGWFVAPLVAVPWYYMAAQSGSSSGSFVKRQIFFENIDRFFGSAGIPDKPFWYYLEHFWSQAAPWSLVFGLIVVSLIELRMKRLNLSDFLGNSASKRFVFDASLIWVFSSLVLFSLSSGKRRGYLLAILPPVAVVVVLGAPLAFWAFKRLAEALKCKGLSEPWSFRAWIALHFVTACSGAFVIGISCFDSAPVGAISEEKWAVVAMLPQVLGERALSLGFVVLLLGCLSLYCFKLGQTKRQGILTLCALVCYLQIILIGFVGSGLALKGEVHAYRDFAQEIAELTEGVERLRFIKERRDESFDCFFFYFKRRILLHDPNMLLEADEMYLSRTARFEQLEIPQHMKAEIVARGGRFVDEPEEEIVLFKLHSIPS